MSYKIAVLFPGIGYTKNHPLLYYSGKLALSLDYKLKTLSFSGFPRVPKGDRDALLSCFQIAREQAEQQLRFIDFGAYDDIVFISKSIGTVAASVYAKKHSVPARHIYFTPLEQTFSLIEEPGALVYHGTNDPWVNTDTVRYSCEKRGLVLKTIENANHSLETDDVYTNINNLKTVIYEVEEYLQGS